MAHREPNAPPFKTCWIVQAESILGMGCYVYSTLEQAEDAKREILRSYLETYRDCEPDPPPEGGYPEGLSEDERTMFGHGVTLSIYEEPFDLPNDRLREFDI